ncbi:hypothetical protein CRG98_041557 [Punica granatum]|uniref:Uncharacterized protein n=1 Tax=Punica granatum TaxID=22663 RepID=A0A2I0I277_PUNGR|nr:hypothetical protein CRG98_041557 [Punica granatum]
MPGLLTRASLLFFFASSPRLLARASCNLAGSAHPCEFTFLLRKFPQPARSCLLQPCPVCFPVRLFFSASQVRRACSRLPLATLPGLLTLRRACSLVPLATLPGLLTRASLLFYFESSPSLLARASCNLAGSAHPCEFTFLLRKFPQPARSCLLQPCRVCSPVRVYFSTLKVPRACSLVPLATLPGLLTRASLHFYLESSPSLLARVSCNHAGSAHPSPSLLARASCNLAGSAHPCEFTFLLRKFPQPARSCLLQPCRVCSPVRVYFSTLKVPRACSLVPLATLPGLLSRATFLFCFASSPGLLDPASCNLAKSTHPCEFSFLLRKFAELARSSLLQPCPGLLARAYCNLAGSAHPCYFTFLLRKFAEPARSCPLQPCRVCSPVCSPVRVNFSASQVRRACSLVPLATLPGLLTRASLFFCLESSPSLLARASCNLARSAHPCEFIFLLRKFPELARSCFLQPCQVCSPVRVYFSALQVRRACSLVPLATLPGLLTRASLLFSLESSPSLLARASCNLAGSAHLCEFTFRFREFAEPARSSLLQPCRVCSPVRVFFSASHVRRASSLVPLASLPASSSRMLARASYNFDGFAHSYEFTFLLCKFTDHARSCLLQPCRVCLSVRVKFFASQVRRACTLVPLATLPGLLTRSSSLLARASCNLAGSAHPCEFTLLLRKFPEPACSFLLQPCHVCSPKVPRACSLVLLATLPGLLTRASLLFCLESLPILLARATCNLAGSAHRCEFTFLLRKFPELARSCFLQPCRVCSSVRVNFSASQVRRACSLEPLATLPGLLTRASLLFCFGGFPSQLAPAPCNLAWPAHPCEFTFQLSKFVEPARSCLLQPCPVCSPVRVYFSALQVRRACSLVPLATFSGLLTRAGLLFSLESSPSLLARASCNLAGSAHRCEFTFLLRKFPELARSCFLLPCRVCSPVRVYFCASQVGRACSLLPLATLPGLLTRASLLLCFASWPSLLAFASCNLAESTHPSEFTFVFRKFAELARPCLLQPGLFVEPARSCLLQPCRIYSPVRVIFPASQVRRGCSLVPLATLLGLFTRASLLFCSKVRRACSLVPLATLPGLLTDASLLFCLESSPSLLARPSCNLAGSAHPCELTFLLRKFVEPARSCLLQPCRVCSPVRVNFSASQVRRACSLVPLATLPGLLTDASLLFCLESSPSLLARPSCNLAGSAHPCEFTFVLRKLAEPARFCLLQRCQVCSPVRVYFCATQVRRARSPLPLTTLPGLLTHASLLFYFGSSPSQLAPASYNLAWSAQPCEFTFPRSKFAEPARSCFLQLCLLCSPERVNFSAQQVRRASSFVPLATLSGLLSVRVNFSASQVRRACSLVPLATLPGLLTHALLLFCLESSPSLLARASCNLAGSAQPCELTFLLRKFVETAPSCLLQPCRVFSPQVRRAYSLVPLATLSGLLSVRVNFSASQVRRDCSLVPLATLSGLLSVRVNFSASQVRRDCSLVPLATLSGLLSVRVNFSASQVRRDCSLVPLATLSGLLSVRVNFSASQVRRDCSLVPLATLSGLLSVRVNFSASQVRRDCSLVPLATLSGLLSVRVNFSASQVRRDCSLVPLATLSGLLSVRVNFSASQVRRDCSLVPLATLSGLLSVRVNFSASQVRRDCSLVPLATLSGLLSVRVNFSASQVRRDCSLVPLATLSGLLSVRVNFSASQVRRDCSLVPLATLSGLLSVRVNFSASQVRRDCSLVPLATLSGLLSVRVNFSASQVRRDCSLVPLATLSGLLSVRVNFSASQVRRDCSLVPLATLSGLLSVRVNFSASQVRRDCSLVPLATLSGLLSVRVNFSASQVRRDCSLVPLATLSGLLSVRVNFSASQVRRDCSLVPLATLSGLLSVRVNFSASQVRRDCSLVPLATLSGLLSVRVNFSASQVRRDCSLVPLATLSGLLSVRVNFSASQVRRDCSLVPLATLSGLLSVRVNFSASQVRRDCSLVPLATLSGLLSVRVNFSASQVRRDCSLVPLATLSGLLSVRVNFSASQVRRDCSLVPLATLSGLLSVRVNFSASQVRRDCSLVPLATLSGLLSVRVNFSASQVRRDCSLVPLATLSGLLSVRVNFSASQVRRDCSLVPLATLSGLLSVRVNFSASQVRRDCSLVPLATLSGLLSVRVNFSASQVRRDCSLVPLATLSGLLSVRVNFSASQVRRDCSLVPLATLSGLLSVRVNFSASQVRRACSLVPLATLPGLLTRASLLSSTASSPSHLARASCNLAGSTHPCELSFQLRKFVEAARSCLLQPCRVYSPVRVYFSASQVRRACSLVPLATLPGLLTHASLLFHLESSPSLLALVSCNHAGSAHPCEFTFQLSKFVEPTRSRLLQPYPVWSPVRVYFSALQDRRACSLVPLATLPGLLTRASLLFCFASSPSLLARASCNLAGSAHPCEFTFLLRKFAELARSCLLQPCRVFSPVGVYFSASKVRQACSLVPLATLPGLLTRASLLFSLESSPSLLACASCNLAGSAHPSSSQLAPAPVNFVWPAHPCEFTFQLSKFVEPTRSCLLQPCPVCSPVRVYFSASQVRRACSILPLATVPGLLTRASLLFCLASSSSMRARASCNLARSAHPCEFTFLLRKFAEPARSCLLQPCRVYSPQVRRACALVPLATLPGLLTRASLLFCFASSPSLLDPASCNRAGSTHPCEFTFLLSKFVEHARSCLLQPCPVCSPVRVYFSASQVRRACSILPLATVPGLLTRASLLFCLASSSSMRARASCNLARSAHPCEFTFLLRKFAEPARSCLLQPCRVYSPQVRRACALVPLATLPGLLTRASLLFCFASSPSLLDPASCNRAGSTHPCEFTFLLSKFVEHARSCLLQPCPVCSPVRVYFSASQVRRACSILPLATVPGLLTRASLLFCLASSSSMRARASCNLARSAHPCEFTFLLRKFAEPARSCLLQPCRVYSPQVRRACALVPLATLPGLLTRASLLFCFASSPSLLDPASCNRAGSTHPCEFTFLLSKFVEHARSCLLQPCPVCSPVRVYFSASQVRRACSILPLATVPGLLTRASLLFCLASSSSMRARASCNLARSAHPCEFTFLLRKFAEPARSCLLQPCRVYSPQVRRACALVPLATLPGLLTRASLLFCFASSPSLLDPASCNRAGSTHPCEFTFLLSKFVEHARSCLLQPCPVCSPVRVYFSASQVRRACSILPLATVPGLLTRASLLFCLASSSSMRARASCNLARSAHPCEFTFLLRKFTGPARSCLMQLSHGYSPVRVLFSASQVRRACSLKPVATLPGLLTCASLLFGFEISPSLLARTSCNLAGSAHPSPSLLARASCNLAGSAHPCEFTFLLRKFAEFARSCLLQPCRVFSPMGVYFSASKVRRACSLVPLATLSGLLTRASLLLCFASSPSLLAPASCNRAGSTHPCEFTFVLRKFAEPARSCLLQPCRVYSPVRVYFCASQVRRACSLLPLATVPGLLTRASLLLCFASSPSLLAPASCNRAGSTHPCEFTFVLRKFAEPARSCLLQPCRVYSPVRVYFCASQVRRACSLLPLATVPGLLTRASLLLCFASSPSLLAPASCNRAGSTHPCEFTFVLRKFAEPARSCLLQPCRVYSPVRVYFCASQVRRACSLLPLATVPGLLTRASLLLCFASSPSLLAPASCNRAGSTHPCEFTFVLRKFAEPARSCLLQPCRVYSPVRVYFCASQVRRACSLLPLATVPGLLTRASLLLCFASSPSLLAPASCNRAGSTHPCEFTFVLRKFAEPARSCLLQPCRVYSPVRVYFCASQVRRACSLLPLATVPGLLTRASLLLCFASSPSLLAPASCNRAGSTHPCEFTFVLRKFAEPARSCLLQPCRVYSPVRVYFCASQVRRACSLLPLATVPGLLTRASLLLCFASSPSLLAPASCNRAGSTHPCEFTFVLRKFAEPARSCLLQPCRVYSPVRVYFCASQVRRACSLLPLATVPGLLTRASLLLCFASSPSLLAPASCNRAGSTHPCEFTFVLRKFAEPARSCLLQPCRVYSPVRVYFCASQVRRACSLLPLATVPGLLTRASLLLCFASSPSLLAPASCNRAGSTHPCEFTFVLRKFAEPARSCLLQPCRVYSPVRVYFCASQVRRACSLLPLATVPGLLTRASLLLCFASSPSLLAPASCNRAGSTHPCEFTFVLRKFAEPARSCLLQPCRVYSPVRVYFCASQVRRACSLLPLATVPGLLTRASLLLCFASSPSLLAPASCNRAGSTHPCEFTFVLRKFAEPARSCLLQPCRVYSPVRVYFCASQVRRACSLVPLATLPGLLTRASLRFCIASLPSLLAPPSCNPTGSAHPSEFTILLLMIAGFPRSCLLHPCRVCSPVRVFFSASQIRRSCSILPLATVPGLLTRASLLFCLASSPSMLARASYNIAGSAHPCELSFLLRKFVDPARSCVLQPRRVCSPVLFFFSTSKVRRACSLVPLATLPGLLTRASLLFCFASSPSLLDPASCNRAGSAHPCEFTFLLRKFAEPARSCLLQPCRVCSPVRVYFSASQVRRACSILPLATVPGLLTRASLLFCLASSPSMLTRASYNLAGSAPPCELSFLLRKFVEPAHSCVLQPRRVCSPVLFYFSAPKVRRACSLVPLATLPGLLAPTSLLFCLASSSSMLARASYHFAGFANPCDLLFYLASSLTMLARKVHRAYSLVPLATLPGLLTRASLLFCLASSSSMLARASCNLARSAHPCEFTFLLSKFVEHARSCLLQPCPVCSPVRVYFSDSQVRRAYSLVPHATLPCQLTRASLLFYLESSPSLLARASCNLAGSAHPCEFTFLHSKFTEHARSFLLQPCRIYSPVRVIFPASQVRRGCSLVPLATLLGLLTRASLLLCFESSPSLLARASCSLAGSAHRCEFTFLLRKIPELVRSCFLQPCRVCSPARVYFCASQVGRASSLLSLATLLSLLTRPSLLLCFASSPSLLAPASCNRAGSAHRCEFTFLLRKFAEPARSCLLQPCRQVRRACSLVPLATLPDLVTRASLLFCFASSPSLLARASCNLAGSAHPCEFTFLLRKFAELARSCLLQPCRVCSPVRVYFSALQVRRACSLVPLATLPGLLTRASLLFYLESSSSLLARASCNLAGSAHPCEFTFLLRKFLEPARSCLLQPSRVCSPVRVNFSASQVRRACSLLPLATLPGLLTRASLLFCFASSLCLLDPASCNLAKSTHPCEFTFLLRKFAELARSSLLQPCPVCSPVRVYFSASKFRRAGSLVPLATFPGLLTRASLLFCFASSPSLLAQACCNLARSAHLCEFTFLLRNFAEPARSYLLQPFRVCSPFAEPARSCLLQPCRLCSPVRVYFSSLKVRRACSLVPLATLPALLTRASLLFCLASSPSMLARASSNLVGSAHPPAGSAHLSEFTILLLMFAGLSRSCLLHPCRVCSPVRVYFSASQVRRACSILPLATVPGLLTRASLFFCLASSPSLLAPASCNLARSAHPCEFTFLLSKFTEPARSSLLQPCRVCSPVRVYYSASHVRRASSLVPLASLPGLLTRASLLFCFASSPSLLDPASCNRAGPAHPCEFIFLLSKFTEHARSCLSQPCWVCPPVRVIFSASQVRRSCSLVRLATSPGLLTRAILLFCSESSPSLLARASCNLAGSAHPCEFTFLLTKFTDHARSCLLQPCRVCFSVRVNFSASLVRRGCSLVPLATLPGLLTQSSPSLLARASSNLAGSDHRCEFTFMLRKFTGPARSCLMQPSQVYSPVRVYFSASHVRRACSLKPVATLLGLLTCASLIFCFEISPSLLARTSCNLAGSAHPSPSLLTRASCNLAGSAHPCKFTFLLSKFAEPARSSLLQPCRVCSPVRVYYSASHVRRASSLVPLASLPGLLTRTSLLFCFASSPSLLDPASCNRAGSAHPCEFTFLLSKLTEHARSCLLQPGWVCPPVRVIFSASHVRRTCLLVRLATSPGLLTRAVLIFCFESSPSLLARAPCNLAGSAHPCEFTFLLSKFAEPARSCLLQPGWVCPPVRVIFSASQVRRACSIRPLATVPGLLTRPSLLFCFSCSPGFLARASCIPAESAHPCEFTFLLRKFAEPARSCLLQPCRVCSTVRVHFSAWQVHRVCSLVPLTTLLGLPTRASYLFCFASSSNLLARASCNLAGSAHPCYFTFLLRKFTEPARSCPLQPCRFVEVARSCLLQPCRVCSPVRVYFCAPQVRRACSPLPLTTLPGLLTHASLLFYFGSSPSQLSSASYNLAWSALPCEFTFPRSKFAEPACSCFLQLCLLCSPERVNFSA